MSGLTESGRAADIGRLSGAITLIAAVRETNVAEYSGLPR